MPKRTDIESILVIGSGPIVIGQACEFDYSGTQACRVLRAEGYRVVLVNSNPATIMTDPELADATYVEPLDLDTLTRVIEKERPDALLPTLGGQTALNLAVSAAEAGVLDRFGVELIGAGVEAIHTAEDRRRFKAAMVEIGLSVPKSGIAYSLEEALAVGEEIGYPLICRPSFILGGGGTGFAADSSELEVVAANGLAASPVDGVMVIIEMNPRVSRSSALASKATGFPIAKIAAKLAVGYRLDEVMNDITGETPASFEPTIDYVVVKIPRFAFEKFSGVPPVLGTKMQSVGEGMALGRTFTESVQKACRSLETGRLGLNGDRSEVAYDVFDDDELVRRAAVATPDRLFHLEAALRRGITDERLHEASGVDPWFLDQIAALVEERAWLAEAGSPAALSRTDWRRVKRAGFSDAQLAHLFGVPESDVRSSRIAAGVTVTYKTVDTCAAEFAARTPYHYSTWEDEDEVAPLERPAVVILGSGPNRIGQGIEFDYCCVHAAFELSAAGFETVMVNCNPETVSTDYDTSDRLFFEPLTPEDVLNVCGALSANLRGVIVSLGGQTPLKLAHDLELAGLPVLGTSPDSIDLAEDRERFNALCDRLGIPQPPGGVATEVEGAVAVATRVEYPVLVRPSYVLGGRAMEIVYEAAGLRAVMGAMAAAAESGVC